MANATENAPRAGAPAGIGSDFTCQVAPRSEEWKTREDCAPPVTIQASTGPATVSALPLAAKAPSFSSASRPLPSRWRQVAPPSALT
ncbi:hypothetical protein CR103_18910 [Massilia psychrophila]|uniref:Uncharacterized protein n=1 Tax=Massilia psychrophila TaxID=1603353 RepID=A0A2G8SXS0_9BURK|nr:hypothetical protein CR103_18910 [Massilia psychrophila]